jgi:PPOX class probable F420-dependent enzyme
MPATPIRLNEATRDALTTGRLAHLVTLNDDGSPQVTCVYVGLDGDDIVAGHLSDHKKLHNIRRDPRVALSVESDLEVVGFSPYLTVSGVARIVEGGAPELLRRITTEYFGAANSFPPPGDAPAGWVLHISPTKVYGSGPWGAA